jgi:hypothetical protein
MIAPQPPDAMVSFSTSRECRIVESGAIAERVQFIIPAWIPLERGLMVGCHSSIPVSDEMYKHLEHEASRRNISIDEAYREEMDAREELAKITPRNADLLKIAARFPAPQTWYDE